MVKGMAEINPYYSWYHILRTPSERLWIRKHSSSIIKENGPILLILICPIKPAPILLDKDGLVELAPHFQPVCGDEMKITFPMGNSRFGIFPKP